MSNITSLEPHQILVVGTNAIGVHAGGAAAQAYKDLGALMGCARGPIGGQSYGIVTLDDVMHKVSLKYLNDQALDLRIIATNNPSKEFLLTPIGTGIAGFDIEIIHRIFSDMPKNVKRVGDWK